MSIKLPKAEVIYKLSAAGFQLLSNKEINHATQLRFSDGTIVNIYRTGTVLVQGTDPKRAQAVLSATNVSPAPAASQPVVKTHPEPASTAPTRQALHQGKRMSSQGDFTTPEHFIALGLDPKAPFPGRHPDWCDNPPDQDSIPF